MAHRPAPFATPSIVHVIAAGPVGGAESMVALLAAAQRARGSRVAVVAVQIGEPAENPFVDSLREASVDVIPLRLPGRAYLRERRAIAEICASRMATVVHSHGYRTDVVDGLFAGRRGIPVVGTVHGFTGGSLRNRLYQWLQRRAYRKFDAVVAVSAAIGRQLIGSLGSSRLHVLPNAYRAPDHTMTRDGARAALGLPEKGFVVGWVGRLSPEKGADVFLDALASRELVGVQAAILGDGPEARELRARATRLGLGARVTWVGNIAHAERYFAAFDAFVLSSRTEGTPMVILEAMAAGVPIVATRVGGVPDVLVPGTALLVNSESPGELALAIQSVMADRPAATSRAQAARDRLDREYSVSAWVERYETIYQRASERAARRVQR